MEKTELRLQAECFQYHWNAYAQHRYLLFKVKNEGHNRITVARDKATGLIPGVSDMILLIPGGQVVFFEFKTEVGKQSPAQKEWQKKVNGVGFHYFIIRSLAQFKNILSQIYAN